MEKRKLCRQTRAIQTHRILPFDCNYHQTLYGGRLLDFIDNCASISASKHIQSEIVTASLDTMNFIRPLNLSDSVTVETFVSGTGKSSVEVFAKVVGEELHSSERYLAATAFLTFVALKNKNGQPVYVKPIQPETQEEQFICSGYQKRQNDRLEKRRENKFFNEFISVDVDLNY